MRATNLDILYARAANAKPSKLRRLVLTGAIRTNWTWLWRVYVWLLCALLCACSFDVPSSLIGRGGTQTYREMYPDNPAPCIAVAVWEGDCSVATMDGTVQECVTGADALVIYHSALTTCVIDSLDVCDCEKLLAKEGRL